MQPPEDKGPRRTKKIMPDNFPKNSFLSHMFEKHAKGNHWISCFNKISAFAPDGSQVNDLSHLFNGDAFNPGVAEYLGLKSTKKRCSKLIGILLDEAGNGLNRTQRNDIRTILNIGRERTFSMFRMSPSPIANSDTAVDGVVNLLGSDLEPRRSSIEGETSMSDSSDGQKIAQMLPGNSGRDSNVDEDGFLLTDMRTATQVSQRSSFPNLGESSTSARPQRGASLTGARKTQVMALLEARKRDGNYLSPGEVMRTLGLSSQGFRNAGGIDLDLGSPSLSQDRAAYPPSSQAGASTAPSHPLSLGSSSRKRGYKIAIGNIDDDRSSSHKRQHLVDDNDDEMSLGASATTYANKRLMEHYIGKTVNHVASAMDDSGVPLLTASQRRDIQNQLNSYPLEDVKAELAIHKISNLSRNAAEFIETSILQGPQPQHVLPLPPEPSGATATTVGLPRRGAPQFALYPPPGNQQQQLSLESATAAHTGTAQRYDDPGAAGHMGSSSHSLGLSDILARRTDHEGAPSAPGRSEASAERSYETPTFALTHLGTLRRELGGESNVRGGPYPIKPPDNPRSRGGPPDPGIGR
jgi:hypothetical protein